MRLTISILAASAVLRFTTPGPGTYYLFSTADYRHAKIIASGHVKVASHVTATVPRDEIHRLFFVQFDPPSSVPSVP